MVDVPSVHRISHIYHIFIIYKDIWCLCNSDVWIYSWESSLRISAYLLCHISSSLLKVPITQIYGLFRELFLHRALGSHIPKHTHFCNAAAWTASRLQTKPCKLSFSHKHQATSRRAKQGHKPGTQTNLELACKIKHHTQGQIKDAETSSARERNRAFRVEITAQLQGKAPCVIGGPGQKHFRDSVKASLSGWRPMDIGILRFYF